MVLKRIWQKLGDTLPTTNDPAPPPPLRCPLVFYEWWGLQAPWSPSRLSSGSSKSRQPPRHLTVFLILVLTWTATAITMQLPCLPILIHQMLSFSPCTSPSFDTFSLVWCCKDPFGGFPVWCASLFFSFACCLHHCRHTTCGWSLRILLHLLCLQLLALSFWTLVIAATPTAQLSASRSKKDQR